ncbi:MAG: hypothetical protein ACYDHM_13150 [Acidiferrobacterales bacterium]
MTAIPPLRGRSSIALVLFCASLIVPGLAAATEWSAKPSVSLNLQHDSNLLLTSGPHESVTGLTLAPMIDLAAQQENWDITGSAELRSHRYWGQSGLNGNDQLYNFSSLYRTQRSTWQLGGGYAKESVTANTAFSPGIGLVSNQTQRITRNINPSWTWQITERTQLQLNYQTSLVSYQNIPNSSLIDYTSRDGIATLSYELSHQNQLTVQLDRNYFAVPQESLSQLGQPSYTTFSGVLDPNPLVQSNTSTTDSLVLGWSHSFSQTLSTSLAAGARRTNSDSVVQTCTASTPIAINFITGLITGTCTQTATTVSSDKSNGYVYNAEISKQFELTDTSLTLGQQISPSGIGAQVQMDSATLVVNHKLSARLTSGLSLSDYQVRAIGSTAPTLTDENYVIASTHLSWEWTRRLTVRAGYRYTTLKFLNRSVTAHDNAVYLRLDYAWRRFSISR